MREDPPICLEGLLKICLIVARLPGHMDSHASLLTVSGFPAISELSYNSVCRNGEDEASQMLSEDLGPPRLIAPLGGGSTTYSQTYCL